MSKTKLREIKVKLDKFIHINPSYDKLIQINTE